MIHTKRTFASFAVDDIDAARRFYGDTLVCVFRPPAIEAWAERCRTVLQEHWPSEVGRFDAPNKKAFADTFFHGTQGRATTWLHATSFGQSEGHPYPRFVAL